VNVIKVLITAFNVFLPAKVLFKEFTHINLNRKTPPILGLMLELI
tara:strand:- start:79 stop:213 length:135 start_codon:yes stop_codon:yes gene_type:complete